MLYYNIMDMLHVIKSGVRIVLSVPRCLLAVIFGLAITSNVQAKSAPVVVTSITPVHALASGVMDGVGTPVLLVPPGQSPHTYALKPSDARILASAQVVFWIGKSLETFLPSTLKNLSQARSVDLLSATGVTVLPLRQGGMWVHTHHEHEHIHEPGNHTDAGKTADPHIWLDPRNATAMTVAIADILSELDPANAQTYRANAASLRDQLQALEERTRNRLAPVHHHPFLVFHDAFQYAEHRFDLVAVGAVNTDPALSPGARHLGYIRDLARQQGVSCLFAEPSHSRRTVDRIARETGSRTGILDPLGGGDPRETGVKSYMKLIDDLSETLVSCLSGVDAGHLD